MSLVFEPTLTSRREFADGFAYDAQEGLPYVTRPVAAIQRVNVYSPAAYRDGGTVNGYTRETAPILMPNLVGGYLAGAAGDPTHTAGWQRGGTIVAALKRGYVVVAAGIRGRDSVDATGRRVGYAPALLVDMKAAIRWVKFNAGRLPGNVARIITNGTSAGGALSAVTAASGNSPAFAAALTQLGAAPATDDVFAASVYCPIHNLAHADMAYEWQFQGINDYTFQGVTAQGRETRTGTLTPAQQGWSQALAAAFPAYVNGLQLQTANGVPLRLAADGTGTLHTEIVRLLLASAQAALDAGVVLPAASGITVAAGQATALDWQTYLRYIGRMKPTPAFDSLTLESAETNEFGDRHFSAFGQQHDQIGGASATAVEVAAIDPLTYIGHADTAKYWRIRHGAADRDTGFAVPLILALTLQQHGASVDFELPWDQGHGGDYDLPELFAWIDALMAVERHHD